jgi:hypothetical protein
VRSRRPQSRLGWGIAFIAVLVLAVIAVNVYSTYGTQRTVEFTVKHRERTGGDQGKYLVYTDQGVFEDTDSIFYLKFDSSDVYNQLEEGGTYRCDVYGRRFGLFSWYPNIKSCDTLAAPPSEAPPDLPPTAIGGD